MKDNKANISVLIKDYIHCKSISFHNFTINVLDFCLFFLCTVLSFLGVFFFFGYFDFFYEFFSFLLSQNERKMFPSSQKWCNLSLRQTSLMYWILPYMYVYYIENLRYFLFQRCNNIYFYINWYFFVYLCIFISSM